MTNLQPLPDLDDVALRARFDNLFKLLRKEIEDRLRRFAPQKTPTVPYHYTNPRGLKGIVDDSAIHLTDSSFLNDKSELIYGRDLAREVLAECAASSLEEAREFAVRVSAEGFHLDASAHQGS